MNEIIEWLNSLANLTRVSERTLEKTGPVAQAMLPRVVEEAMLKDDGQLSEQAMYLLLLSPLSEGQINNILQKLEQKFSWDTYFRLVRWQKLSPPQWEVIFKKTLERKELSKGNEGLWRQLLSLWALHNTDLESFKMLLDRWPEVLTHAHRSMVLEDKKIDYLLDNLDAITDGLLVRFKIDKFLILSRIVHLCPWAQLSEEQRLKLARSSLGVAFLARGVNQGDFW